MPDFLQAFSNRRQSLSSGSPLRRTALVTDNLDINRQRAAVVVRGPECHPLALIQAPEAVHQDRALVAKVIAPILSLNKTKAFFTRKPFYCSCHSLASYFYFSYTYVSICKKVTY
jgi:hypothetical protein